MKPVSDTFIDVRRLRILRELREHRTVVATARAVHLTPSAVSQQLAALSREVGAPLMARQGRGVRLTPQAMLLLDHAAVMLAQMERARADLEAFEAREVRPVAVGAFATAIQSFVAPAIRMLARKVPALRVVVQEIEAPEVLVRLDAGDLDLMVTIDYRSGPTRGDARYARRDLLLDPYDVVLPAKHHLAQRRTLTLTDLNEESWILGASSGPCGEVTRAACTSAGFSPNIRHHVNEWTAVFTLVAANQGVALAPRLATDARYEGIVIRPLGAMLFTYGASSGRSWAAYDRNCSS
ncbi:LysR family transcriptional regulator [Pendulispora albinea]|uniref:LysR family transcriptional regulator n=1 Tax=Pendulispora albinea TaxID=2741071 RepID=A0ABZ2MA89_9BACT